MIIVGYQGIGKSTLTRADHSDAFIDLESSNFWFKDDDGKNIRWPNWYDIYCNLAEDLSSQGYIVFVSSHKAVRERLKRSTVGVCAIAPASYLKDEWIEKLEDRYNSSNSEKDYKALMNAKECYESNVTDILNDCKGGVIIDDIHYDLEKSIHHFMNATMANGGEISGYIPSLC